MTTTTARIEPTTLPPLEGKVHEYGYDGRHRLYTVEHLPFGALPSYRDGGPSMVTTPGWSMSTSSLCRVLSSEGVVAADDGRHTLSLRSGVTGMDYLGTKHELDGTKYATDTEARQAAYEAGALAYMVFERYAAALGLPTVD